MATFVEETKTRPPVLKAKYQVGCRSAPMRYPQHQKVFHVKDIPKDKLEAKLEVQDSLKSKLLSSEKPMWNVQTSTGDKVCHRRTYVNSTLNRSNMFVYNYRAEKLPSSYPMLPTKSNKFNTGILEVKLANLDPGETFNDDRIAKGISKQIEELPNHPDLRDKVRWNISSDIRAPIHKELFLKSERSRVKNSSKRNNSLKEYRSPEQLHSLQAEELRKVKTKQLGREADPCAVIDESRGLYDRLIQEKERQAEKPKEEQQQQDEEE